ncbi:MAG: hypothetical protein AAB217_13270 [Chloroflexota bacterium]
METVLPAFIVIILLLSATLMPAQHSLAAQDRIQLARQAVEARLLERARTDLASVNAQVSDNGAVVDIRLRNAGQTRLADFDRWDVMIQYYDTAGTYHIVWLPYFEGGDPANNEWAIEALYVEAAGSVPEIYEPGILNPAEEMVIRFRVSPAVGHETTNLAVLSTPNGLRLSTYFIRPPLCIEAPLTPGC